MKFFVAPFLSLQWFPWVHWPRTSRVWSKILRPLRQNDLIRKHGAETGEELKAEGK